MEENFPAAKSALPLKIRLRPDFYYLSIYHFESVGDSYSPDKHKSKMKRGPTFAFVHLWRMTSSC